MTMTKEDQLVLAVESLRSARAFLKDRHKDQEAYAYWKRQCEVRRSYVQDLEKMHKMKYHKLFN